MDDDGIDIDSSLTVEFTMIEISEKVLESCFFRLEDPTSMLRLSSQIDHSMLCVFI